MLNDSSSRQTLVSLLVVLVTAFVVRLAYLALIPSYAYSWDMSCWEEIASFIGTGTNPYATTTSLSWPPLWLICLFLLDRTAELGGVAFLTVLRLFLLLVESVLITLLWVAARRAVSRTIATRVAMFGLVLNPVAILLTCQHGNFDSLVALWVMAMLLALCAYHRSQEPMDWLLACFFLGLGVLSKTVPFALAPLLMPGARALTPKARLLGATLFAGPSALGLGVLFALEPDVIVKRVFLYSPVPGRFGVSGIANVAGFSGAIPMLGRLASLLILGLVAWGCVKAWAWHPIRESQLVLLTGMILLAIPTLGPGFGTQYAFWFLAPLALSYLAGSKTWKIALVVGYAVTALTYIVIYGFARDLGQSIVYLWMTPTMIELGRTITRDVPRAWLCMPMWASWVGLLVLGIPELRDTRVRAQTSS